MTTDQSMSIEIDYERCQAHGMCAATAPDLFGLRDDTAQALPLVERVTGDQVADAQAAADTCPELAIRLVARD
jgi:ferredoxin